MGGRLSTREARECAHALIEGTKFGEWTSEGLQLTVGGAEAFRRAGLSELVDPISDSRKSPSNNDFDLYAESVWHALSAVLFQELRGRIHRGTFANAMQKPNIAFSGRPFYRGQTRAWDIIPSAWRGSGSAGNSAAMTDAFCKTIQAHFDHWPDVIAHMVGRPDFRHACTGIAQHYGFATNLVDLTLNPLAAVCFACGDTEGPPVQPRDIRSRDLSHCAVVYVIAAPALSLAARLKFEFPPSYSFRLYQQKGMFADFGDYPGAGALRDLDSYAAPWCSLQQNSQRIFFPRSYPSMDGADELKSNSLMQGDSYLQSIVDRVKNNQSAAPGDVPGFPPWHFDPADMSQLGKASREIFFRIDAYLRRACLVKFEDGDYYDPWMVSLLLQGVSQELKAFCEIAADAKQPGMVWSAERLRQTSSALDV